MPTQMLDIPGIHPFPRVYLPDLLFEDAHKLELDPFRTTCTPSKTLPPASSAACRTLLIMQHPTLHNVRIRSTRDALQVFHGVATHRLPLITRRLDAEERRNIVPGNVYVWYVVFKFFLSRDPFHFYL